VQEILTWTYVINEFGFVRGTVVQLGPEVAYFFTRLNYQFVYFLQLQLLTPMALAHQKIVRVLIVVVFGVHALAHTLVFQTVLIPVKHNLTLELVNVLDYLLAFELKLICL
jgi:hypothetical protein